MTQPLTALFAWIKANKLSTFLIAVLAYFIIQQYRGGVVPMPLSYSTTGDTEMMPIARDTMMDVGQSAGSPMMAKIAPMPPIGNRYGMNTDVSNRMVSKTTNLSLKVNNVSETVHQIDALATQLGGFTVNSSISDLDDVASGYISLRVPTVKRDEALAALRQTGVRVVSESVDGTDITDQYQDTTEQLNILTATKTKVEGLLNKAGTVSEMLEAQRELMNLQSQIDSLKGQQEYLAKSAEFTLISAYLSTDELALPYTPGSQAWRPGVVFKEATRGLLATFRSVGNGLIWAGVYAPIWLPILVLLAWWNKRSSIR